jgi:hypothetical protein
MKSKWLFAVLLLQTSAVNADSTIEVVVMSLAAGTTAVKLSIPQDALIARNAIPGVFVIANGESRFRMVRPGNTRRGQVEILSGLFGAAQLIVEGQDKLHDGSKVRVRGAAAAGDQ